MPVRDGEGDALNESRELLGRFLRERRARITLSQAGLPARRARRGRTLTQEDVAYLTGYSIRTISALEQGAEHRPTPGLLEAIASALRLSQDERSVLWYLANGTPPPEPDSVTEPDPALHRLVNALEPHPAYVTDDLWNVQGQNSAFARWICDFTAMPADQRTILHWFFLHEHSRHVMVDWEYEATALMSLVRGRAMRSPRGHELMAVVDDLRERSPDAERIWAGGTDLLVQGPSRPMLFREPGRTGVPRPDDEDHHVQLTITTLAPVREGAGHRLLAFLLPDGYLAPAGSDGVCAACHPAR
ncbi:helix-turn-helix transcriptional regulator [Nonomuraea sp. MCN248]|uniref:Helix-turn-helix transcriptional regulator n=1 Tax=Nonomuraea corallina TaxID=2989783 RepID=A0ABT4S591_9ACTN|nr:helix-turn-helix transcriptional regulator [Nonomuraea corallina]MDA0632111.1 helix-turn-helix transcriptional regulator [Nonomuraea corallina]